MTCWDILGIAKTNDQKIIRRAYATVLKTIDQETDAAQFIALREAFESAKQEAENDYWEQGFEDAEINSSKIDDSEPSESESVAAEYESADSSNNSDHTLSSTLQYQQGFEYLLQAIQQQNSEINLNVELRDYIDSILSADAATLSQKQAQDYLQQLHNACIAADLDGLYTFLNLPSHKIFLSQLIDLKIDQQPVYASEVKPVAELEIEPQQQNLEEQNNSQQSEELSQQPEETVTQQTSQNASYSFSEHERSFQQQLDDLCQTIWNETFDDATFEIFEQFLQQWQHHTLEQQMESHDQLAYALGAVNDTSPFSNRFFDLWYRYFGNEPPSVSADENSYRLYERIKTGLDNANFWQRIPSKLLKPMHALQQPESFQPFKMFKLLLTSDPLINDIRADNWLNIPDTVTPENNINLHFIKIWSHWKTFLPVQLLFSLMCMFLAAELLAELHVLPLYLLLSLAYFPLVISFGLAKILSLDNHQTIANRFTTVFYLGIILIGLLSPMINSWVMAVLLSIWVVLATFVLSYALYFYNSIFYQLQQVIQIVADKFFVHAGLVIVISIITSIIFRMQASNQFGVMFAILPICVLLCVDYFNNFAHHVYQQTLNATRAVKLYALLFFVVAFVTVSTLLIWSDASKALLQYFNIPLTLFLAGSIGLCFISSKALSYICKYLGYVLAIAASIATIVLPMLFAYWLYLTNKQDRQS